MDGAGEVSLRAKTDLPIIFAHDRFGDGYLTYTPEEKLRPMCA